MEGSEVPTAANRRFRRGEESNSKSARQGRGSARIGRALKVLIVVDAVSFLGASIIHFGISIPLGLAVLSDVPILPAAIVEGAIGIAFVLAAAAVFTRQGWAWSGTLGAHLFGILGVLVGLSVTLRNPDGTSTGNFWFHLIILPVLVAGILLLLIPRPRAAVVPTKKDVP